MPVQNAVIAHAHEAIDKLVAQLQADAIQHSFQLDALQTMNRELTATNAKLLAANAELHEETSRLQAEIEGKAALPDASVKAPRKPRAPKAPPAPVVDADQP
jgi:hypothetical protein